jgi:hypothetical protein
MFLLVYKYKYTRTISFFQFVNYDVLRKKEDFYKMDKTTENNCIHDSRQKKKWLADIHVQTTCHVCQRK